MTQRTTETRREIGGLPFGAGAYLFWGFFPLYWPLLEPAGSLEVLAHRIVWSLVFVAILLAATRRWTAVATVMRNRSLMIVLGLASVAIAVNWGGFIYGVTSGHVLETSLGYFINPLVTVLVGVLVLKETLRPAQWFAIGVVAVAVTVLTIDYGRPPWIALLLAFSFATYGFLKKRANLRSADGLALETLILAPFALTFLVVLQARGTLTFGHEGWANALLLAGTGVLTAIPLLLFGAAATRLSLTAIGLLQYLTPTLQFLLGLLVFDEQMSTVRWIGFALVWSALVIFTTDALRHRRRHLRRAAEAAAV